jgi:hypothetical protein
MVADSFAKVVPKASIRSRITSLRTAAAATGVSCSTFGGGGAEGSRSQSAKEASEISTSKLPIVTLRIFIAWLFFGK